MSKPRLLNAYTPESQIIRATYKSGYAEVGTWVDKNPNKEDRIGYFVAIDNTSAGTTIVKATTSSDVRGVTVEAPAFSGNCSKDKFDDEGHLLQQYDYVAVIGLVPVIDNGTCTVNSKCMPSNDGTAIPSTNNMGYPVINRIDDTHILISVEPGADMLNRIKDFANATRNALNSIEATTEIVLSASGWSSSAPYTQTISLANVTPDSRPEVYLYYPDSITENNAEAYVEAYGYINKIVTGEDQIIATAFYEKPAVDITLTLKGIGTYSVGGGGGSIISPDIEESIESYMSRNLLEPSDSEAQALYTDVFTE